MRRKAAGARRFSLAEEIKVLWRMCGGEADRKIGREAFIFW